VQLFQIRQQQAQAGNATQPPSCNMGRGYRGGTCGSAGCGFSQVPCLQLLPRGRSKQLCSRPQTDLGAACTKKALLRYGMTSC
jgi:hypothetical protein